MVTSSQLSAQKYPKFSGTYTSTDFVEFPSQVNEHWLDQPEVLAEFAIHAETGEPMPKAMIEKLLASQTFNQGFATVEFLSSAVFDMDLHMREDVDAIDVHAAEMATR